MLKDDHNHCRKAVGFCCCHVFGHLNWQPGCYGATSVGLIGQSRTSLQTQAGVLWPSWRLLACDWSDRVTWFKGTSKHTKWWWFWQLVCKADAQLHLCKLWHEIIVDFIDLYSIVLRALWLNCSVFFTCVIGLIRSFDSRNLGLVWNCQTCKGGAVLSVCLSCDVTAGCFGDSCQHCWLTLSLLSYTAARDEFVVTCQWWFVRLSFLCGCNMVIVQVDFENNLFKCHKLWELKLVLRWQWCKYFCK